jgi:hypothetical protein
VGGNLAWINTHDLRSLIFRIILVPQELMALEARKVLGFGEEGLIGFHHRNSVHTGHVKRTYFRIRILVEPSRHHFIPIRGDQIPL